MTTEEILGDLAIRLSALEDWLTESCEARHADSMAQTVHQAWNAIEAMIDMITELKKVTE